MKKIIIKFDFSHGPIWKENIDLVTGKWTTGVEVIDNDDKLEELDEEASREYSSLYSFDDKGNVYFDQMAFEKRKDKLLSLVQKIISRLNEINDGSYVVVDETIKL